MRTDPYHPGLNINFASILLRRGEVGRAEAIARRLTENPAGASPYAYNFLRVLYRGTGRLVDMNLIAKRQVLEQVAVHYYGLVLSYGVLGNWSAAAYWNDRSRKEYPDHWFEVLSDAAHLFHQGRYREAADAWADTVQARGLELEGLGPVQRYWAGSFIRWPEITNARSASSSRSPNRR